MTSSERVVHLKREPYDVRIDRETAWGNPYVLGRDGDREEVLAKYRRWVTTSDDRSAQWVRDNVHRLRGKTLGCWCAPQLCHGDVLLELAKTAERRKRILVCGSRTFDTGYVVDYELDYISSYYGGNILIIHGGANGADRLGGKWAETNGVPFDVYVADWNQFGKRAGYLRNTRMLEEGKPDAVIAFVDKPLGESKGTNMMVDIARNGGVPCRVVEHRAYVLQPLQTKD